MVAPPPPRHPVPDHIPEDLREAFATTKGRELSAHCPFKPGDAVHLRGCPGEMPGHRRTGFRGWVVATVGATILTGITTDGEEWWEYWGRLEPEGPPQKAAVEVQRRRQATRSSQHAELASHPERSEQLDLFPGGTG